MGEVKGEDGGICILYLDVVHWNYETPENTIYHALPYKIHLECAVGTTR
jgi:hypothetical protein